MNIVKMALILAVFCLASAGSLYYVNTMTQPEITNRAVVEEDSARRGLLLGDTIDLLDIPDGTYTCEWNQKNHADALNLVIKERVIRKLEGRIPGDVKATDQQVDELTAKYNTEKKITTFSLDENLQALMNLIKSALQKAVAFECFLVAGIPVSDSSDPGKSWTLRKIFRVEQQGSLEVAVQMDRETSLVYKYDPAGKRLQLVSCAGKKFDELPQQVFLDNGRTDKKYLLNPSFDRYFIGSMGGKPLGVVSTFSTPGYGGPIRCMTAFDFTGRIKGTKVLSHTETPGLGAKIAEINPLTSDRISTKYSNPNMNRNKPWFQEQFKGLSIKEAFLSRENSDGKVDAITAATISSKAVTGAIRQKMNEFLELKDFFGKPQGVK
ncbi:MAG: FMN-binding protein [Candidatus Wallbacteria bacterium]|nr:FMN-binding protein [Candidatus Wallbacteria bacterium]